MALAVDIKLTKGSKNKQLTEILRRARKAGKQVRCDRQGCEEDKGTRRKRTKGVKTV